MFDYDWEEVMNLKRQLKKRQVKDKNGEVEEYIGKPMFFANPVTPGYSGAQKKVEEDKNGKPVEYIVQRIDKKAKECDINKQIKKQIKENKKLNKIKERIHEKDNTKN